MRTLGLSLGLTPVLAAVLGCGTPSNGGAIADDGGGASTDATGSATDAGTGGSSGSGGGSSGAGSSSGGSGSGSSSGTGGGSGSSSGSGTGGDSGVGGTDAGGTPGGGLGDAGPPTGGTTVVVMQPGSGTFAPTTGPLHGPGVILMGGGTDVDAAFVWMHDTLAASSTTRMGNVIVLRSDVNTDNTYTAYMYALAPFQSVTTIFLGGNPSNGPSSTATDQAIAAWYVDRADAVFFAGGDQADYVSWKGPLMDAVQRVYARGGVIGGTSAGCAIQGPYIFDDVAADAAGQASVATADAVGDPFESTISFTTGLLSFPSLPGVLADMHFVTRDRFGRLGAFVARQYASGAAKVTGVGVDESNALLVDKNGKATLVQQTGGTENATGSGAYVVTPSGAADTCASGQPLLYRNVKVTYLANPATDSFDFSKGCGTGTAFTVTIDGSNASNPYTPSPYAAAGTATKCP